VNFQVFLDNSLTPAFDSGVMTQAGATQKINLNITGVQTLRLHVDNGGDDTSFDHADWANARVVPAVAPNAPSNLAASAVSATQINLTWTDNSSDETGFRLERGTDGINFTEI